MTATMKIKSIVPYFGGKRTMAPDIVRELGTHKMYVEPCCGSWNLKGLQHDNRN